LYLKLCPLEEDNMQLEELNLEGVLEEVRRHVHHIAVEAKLAFACSGSISKGKKFNILSFPNHLIISVELLKDGNLPKGSCALCNVLSDRIGYRPFCHYIDNGFWYWEWIPTDVHMIRFSMLEKMGKAHLQFTQGMY